MVKINSTGVGSNEIQGLFVFIRHMVQARADKSKINNGLNEKLKEVSTNDNMQ
jgi:hypothetical protein